MRERPSANYWGKLLPTIWATYFGTFRTHGATGGIRYGEGTKLTATKATIAYQRGFRFSTFDAPIAFNSTRRRAILPDLAEPNPPLVPYIVSVNARGDSPKLLLKIDNGETAVVHSSTGVQQGL